MPKEELPVEKALRRAGKAYLEEFKRNKRERIKKMKLSEATKIAGEAEIKKWIAETMKGKK